MVVPAPLHRIPVWVGAGSIVVTHPPRTWPPASATRRSDNARWWPHCGALRVGTTAARLADGTRVSWRGGRWTVEGADPGRQIEFVVRDV